MAQPAIPPLVSVVIPTQRRPGPLALAAGSVLAQAGVDFGRVELVVADNDSIPSAHGAVQALADVAPFKVIYVHEPSPGVANVRNAAMARAGGALIAFLDDDEEAPPGWLAGLLEVQARFDADAVFGPVRGRAPPEVRTHRAYLERFFSRPGPGLSAPDEAAVIDAYWGCGNSLVRRAALPDPATPFSPARNHIGGEDDLLFGAMHRAGARFAWAPQAWVWEDPAPERLSLAYTLRRAFAYGQGPTVAALAAQPPQRFRAARWMATGAVQAAVFGLAAAGQWLLGRSDRAFVLDQAARGLGKLLWGRPFKTQFYGQAAPIMASHKVDQAAADAAS